MPSNSLRFILRYLHRVADAAGQGEISDAELLGRFVGQRDEAAFELLVWRHGPMVLGLCQRLLAQEQDAEDAFQATFLTLARKAGSIDKREGVASWLYKVAYRVACRARRTEPVFSGHSVTLANAAAGANSDLLWDDLRSALDREVASLPERDRRPLVLCYFEGKTHEEAARMLGCPKGTLAARLSRARARLRLRLTRRGWALTTGALAGLLAEQTLSAAVTPELARATVRSVLAYAGGQALAAGILSANVVALSEGVLRMMWVSKLKFFASLVVAVVLAGAGTGLAVQLRAAGARQDKPDATRNELPPPPQAAAKNEPATNNIKQQDEISRLHLELAQALKELKALKLKGQPALNENNFEILRLRHVSAVDVAKVLDEIYQGKNVQFRAVANPVTNALLIQASPADLKKIQLLVQDALDQPGANEEPSIRNAILPLKFAQANEVAAIVRQLYGDGAGDKNAKSPPVATFSVAVDERTNSLVVACSVARLDELKVLVERLDQTARDPKPRRARVLSLKHASAGEIVKILHEIYRDADKTDSFSADIRTNKLVLRCAPGLEEEIIALVGELDVKGAGK
jgi:RNA polymerase sigma factor (sigma-70 family)